MSAAHDHVHVCKFGVASGHSFAPGHLPKANGECPFLGHAPLAKHVDEFTPCECECGTRRSFVGGRLGEFVFCWSIADCPVYTTTQRPATDVLASVRRALAALDDVADLDVPGRDPVFEAAEVRRAGLTLARAHLRLAVAALLAVAS